MPPRPPKSLLARLRLAATTTPGDPRIRSPAVFALVLGLAPAAGRYHFRTHEHAPSVKQASALAEVVGSLSSPVDLCTPRSLQIVATYHAPPVNPIETWETLGVALIPLFPYGRGEEPAPEIAAVGPVLERALARRFAGDRSGPPDYLLELHFTPETYRRLTFTSYGLSLWGGVSDLLGYPTQYFTQRLEAEVKLRDVRGGRADRPPILSTTIGSVMTSCKGSIIWLFPYNAMQKTVIMRGDPIVTLDDLFGEALADFYGSLERQVATAFPRKCPRDKYFFEASVERCEMCGDPLPPPGTRAAPPPASPGAPRRRG